MAGRNKVFISYSHEDTKWLKRLQVHLKPLERKGEIVIWDDTRIIPGAKWEEEIRNALLSAKVAVLLVSADFLASDFISNEEVPSLLAAAAADGTVVMPVIISPSRFVRTPLAQFQSVNPPNKPLVALSIVEQEMYLEKVTEAVEKAFSYRPSTSGNALILEENIPLKEEGRTQNNIEPKEPAGLKNSQPDTKPNSVEINTLPALNPGIAAPQPTDISTLPSANVDITVSQSADLFSPSQIEKLSQELILYLGPIAKILVRKTAAQANSLEDLYRRLSLHIPNETEREAFMKKQPG